MIKIIAVPLNMHDFNVYDGHTHTQLERLSRVKHHASLPSDTTCPLVEEAFDTWFLPAYRRRKPNSILAFSTTKGGMRRLSSKLEANNIPTDWLSFKPTHLWDYYLENSLYYVDHHQSHAALAYISSGFSESDILAIDGRGVNFSSVFISADSRIHDISPGLFIGRAWSLVAKHAGFGFLGAGKLMGLVAYGKFQEKASPVLTALIQHTEDSLPESLESELKRFKVEDLAKTLQSLTETMILDRISPLRSSRNLCVSGGVAYNGYLNTLLSRTWNSVYVPAAVGDEGQALGVYAHANKCLNFTKTKIKVYSGPEVTGSLMDYPELDPMFLDDEDLFAYVANAIANGAVVGWFQGRSESGNRALGNRSILADPRRKDIKDYINSKIKFREDFRPFAPSVLERTVGTWFNTSHPSPYMSKIVASTTDKVPGVTHVDGTSRIQTVNSTDNRKFFGLISKFYELTGVPMLLNTSFNSQEPIVETLEHAVSTFSRTALDMLVVNNHVCVKPSYTSR